MFHFVRDRGRDGDPSRRAYTILRAEERVGSARMTGIGEGLTRLTLECVGDLSESERQELLSRSRSFVEELAGGWGRQVTEVAGVEPGSGWWEAQPGGGFRCELSFGIV